MFLEFPPVSMAEWEAAVRLDLKGKDPASVGKILYSAEDGEVVSIGAQGEA